VLNVLKNENDHLYVDSKLLEIFKKGSTTYFNSSLFFPPRVRKDVTRLYAFVRVADNYVDSIPQEVEKFYQFVEEFYRARREGKSKDLVIDNFVKLEREKQFEESWADSFLRSMEMDIYKKRYETMEELEEYMYGSAEVIGLMMSRILNLDREAEPYAKILGKTMQFVNFIRDIKEDLILNRQYIPTEILRKFGLSSLQEEEVNERTKEFESMMRNLIKLYFDWVKEAEKGYKYIPYRYLIPIKTANDMYKWTAKVIYKSPLVVYSTKVKPKKNKIIARAIENALGVPIWRYFSNISLMRK
jgi:phytoene synthase